MPGLFNCLKIVLWTCASVLSPLLTQFDDSCSSLGLQPICCTTLPPTLLWVQGIGSSIISWAVDLTSWFLIYARGAENVPRLCPVVLSNLIPCPTSTPSICLIRHISEYPDWLHDPGVLDTSKMILQTRALLLNPLLSSSDRYSLSCTL